MRASFLMALIGTVLVFGITGGAYCADVNGSVMSLTVPEPASAERTASYQSSDAAVAPAKAPEADKTAAQADNGTCCPTCVSGASCNGCAQRWVAGVEAVWLSPQQQVTPSTYDVERRAAPTDFFSSSAATVDGLYITPRIWLGYQGEDWGVMTRYWRMCEPGEHASALDEHSNWLSSLNIFKAETFDIEGTRTFCWRDTWNIASFGMRYAELRQESRLEASDVLDDQGMYAGSAFSRHHFSGVGLTAGLAGLKPIGCENLHLFYSLRGSFLWDDKATNYVETTSLWTDGTTTAVDGASTLYCTNGTMFIGEVQVGVQWNFELVRNCSDAFFRFALEYQYWDTSDTGTAVQHSYAGPVGILGTSTATAGDAQVNLIGFTIATGFTW
jgi:hypothetical protein